MLASINYGARFSEVCPEIIEIHTVMRFQVAINYIVSFEVKLFKCIKLSEFHFRVYS